MSWDSGLQSVRDRPRRLEFSPAEVRDLGIAWAALGIAFAVFFGGGASALAVPLAFTELLLLSLLTAGIGFLAHELAHKVLAVRFGQIAEFRASYPMLAFAIAFAFAGFIFAAPGAVYHRGRITARENGLIALAGPVTNIALVVCFVPLLFAPVSIVERIGWYGILINAFLATFNLLPFGPLDGRKVREWRTDIFVLSFLASVLLLGVSVVFLLL